MSENIPSTSANTTKAPSNSPNQPTRKHRKRYYDKLKLPTPPPDPREEKKESCTENEFLEYLEHLQKHTANYSRSTSTLASALIAEDAFDHLERLYKLMEQMLELRAQNAKLHRKIRDLEHLNNLEKMYKEVENLGENETCPELDKDTAFAETILESILYEPKQNLKAKGSLTQSLIRRHRHRSSSATDKPIGLELEPTDLRRASLCVSGTKKPSKVSKWTKVKAAFKWEKASPTVGDSKSLDSGISGIAPLEIARYLRVPSHDDSGHSPSDSGAAEISTPGSLSSASSNENFHKSGRRSPYEELRSSDDEHVYSSHSKEDPNISPRSSQRSHKTPWARMKDIINTRNPVRKKSRLSSHSDDIQIDIELCSDNEEVFEDNSKVQISSSATTSCGKLDSENDIPLEVRERYKSNDDNFSDIDNPYRKVSKWTKVKKAFLPTFDGAEEVSDNKAIDNSDRFSQDFIQSEINRSYRNLQKKLSIEFQEKLNEWKRIKQNTSTGASPTPSSGNQDESSNPAFMKKMEEWEKIKSQPAKPKSNIQMTSEENLPPEFKKKLQEWEKIKKTSMRKTMKKVGDTPRWKTQKSIEAPHIEIPVISEEFKKKLEEWKQIKASGFKTEEHEKKSSGNKTPSPTNRRMDAKNLKTQEEKELQWYEKELNKIEKEKLRLERERQKFMEKEERLSKLRKSVGGHKKDILVHTPSGFYKFEGISKKFTQKLYEWEKSRGIGPESSTFAFLTPEYPKSAIPKVKINGEDHTPPLTRSRSVDSVVVSPNNADCPLVSQPSSLSLNDVDEVEMNCLVDSKSSSVDYIPQQCNEMEVDEPEAMIVEVEDFVEETAAPLKNVIEQHNPVYQCEEVRALCVCLSPKIRRSESARAQTNYSLIEEILTILRHLSENEIEIRKIQIIEAEDNALRFRELCEQQKQLVNKLLVKLQRLQEENSTVVLNLSKEHQNKQSSIIEILEVVQDLSTEIVLMAEKLDMKIDSRTLEKCGFIDEIHTQEIIDEIRSKLLELRRHLSYVCAAADATAPLKRRLCRMKSVVCEKSSNESQYTVSDISQTSEESSKCSNVYIKSDTKNIQSQGAIKKRLRYRVENIRRKSLPDSDEEDCLINNEKIKCPKFFRSRTLSDTSIKSTENIENAETKNSNIFPVVSKSTFQESPARINTDSPVTIFVKTTRKIFTPFVESSILREPAAGKITEQNDNLASNTTEFSVQKEDLISSFCQETSDNISAETINIIPQDIPSVIRSSSVTGLPPLPSSPTPQKKHLKDISPGIRLMLTKYHQKITEQDTLNKSGGSSGSASPVAWRSPTTERRVKAQTEKYQEEIIKLSPIPLRREVQKSASHGQVQSIIRKQISLPEQEYKENNDKVDIKNKGILKTCSAANLTSMKLRSQITKEEFTPIQSPPEVKEMLSSRHSSQLRLQRLKKAKEDFLNSGPSSAPPLDIASEEILEFPKRNRLSQISVESSSSAGSISPGLLVKSVSAGMINIEAEAYRQFEGQTHREYVSLPRNTKPNNPKKSALSNITAKFRKVKMRRGKDKEKFPAVSELCRQSLVVDINENDENQNWPNTSSAIGLNTMHQNVQSAPISKSSSWIWKTKFFKK